jgi:hypothetical protein
VPSDRQVKTAEKKHPDDQEKLNELGSVKRSFTFYSCFLYCRHHTHPLLHQEAQLKFFAIEILSHRSRTIGKKMMG